MMNKILYPGKEEWAKVVERPVNKGEDLEKVCKAVFDEVARDGDEALRKYTWYFDRVKLERFEVTEEEFLEAERLVSEELKEAIRVAKGNIEEFHKVQVPVRCEYVSERGFRCWQEARAIDRVGLYVPGGSAPLFSTVLMLAVPAKLAGCGEVVICTPPGMDGRVNPAILWTARLCGVTRVFKVGGIQAIAALGLGTGSIGRVDKIFGPGNRFVTAAKQWVGRYGVAIDMPAGPSELMVVADETARASFVAADLLSQAEHGPDSQVILVTCDERLIDEVEKELVGQLERIPRKAIAEVALRNSKYIVLGSREECVELVNCYAPEHLMLSVKNYLDWVPEIRNAGSVFLGHYSPESAGDYASGTNHTLPTNGYARMCSGVNMDAFMKKISFQEITPEGLNYLGRTIEVMADNEKLEAHGNAVRVRKIKVKS
ncbi:histidinol dehydrogenase [Odoribacter sp. AF15-53]|nr:histidinol dehydrogenase [Odoribacter sp. AF15-53]